LGARGSCHGLLATLVVGLAAGALALSLPDGEAGGSAPRFLLAWGREGHGPGEFSSPIGIAVSAKDEIYVTDVNNARLQKFTADGTYLGGFDLPWDRPSRRFVMTGGIAVDTQGTIYLSLMGQHRVAVYTDDGRLVRDIGRHGSGDGEFDGPGGLVLAPDGTLYVADQLNHRVQRFTVEGRFLARWGAFGAAAGQFGAGEGPRSRFGGPHFLARDSQGRIYTTEGVLGRVQQFTAEGRPLAAWGDKGDQPGGFGAFGEHRLGPIAILVDRYDRVWVTSLNNRVQVFKPDGTYLFGFGTTGSEPGQFLRPHGLAFDSRGHLYVADGANDRIQKFEVPDLTRPTP
jgi:sugar lactone lactonase YvrE